jgi:hypothetical protein
MSARSDRMFRTILAHYDTEHKEESIKNVLRDLMDYCDDYGIDFKEKLSQAYTLDPITDPKEQLQICEDVLSYDEIEEDFNDGQIADVLGDVITDKKLAEATAINNAGIEIQLLYLSK